MIFAQIKNGIIQNCIILEDESQSSTFSAGFDHLVEIDNIAPMPGAGWTYDPTNGFAPPAQPILTGVAKAQKAQQIGARVMAQVHSINEANLASGTLTQEQFEVMLTDANLEKIERLLWNGSLVTAKAMIQALPNTYFSSEDITSIVAIITKSGLA